MARRRSDKPQATSRRAIDWHYLVVVYQTDASSLRSVLPAPVEPTSGHLVHVEWTQRRMDLGVVEPVDCSVVVPARVGGHSIGFMLRHYCDREQLAAKARQESCEGLSAPYPKLAFAPNLRIGTLHHSERLAAMATLSGLVEDGDLGIADPAKWLGFPRLSRRDLGEGSSVDDVTRRLAAPSPSFVRLSHLVGQVKLSFFESVFPQPMAPRVQRIIAGHSLTVRQCQAKNRVAA